MCRGGFTPFQNDIFLEINYPQKFQTSLEKIPIFNFTKNGADFHDFFIKIEITWPIVNMNLRYWETNS